MKKFILLSVVAMAAATASAQHDTRAVQAQYDIKGTCKADVEWVYLADPSAQLARIDSVRPSDGTFAFKGADAKDNFLALTTGKETYVVFVNDGTPLKVDLATGKLEGSALNNKLNAYDQQLDGITMEQTKLVQPIIDAQKNGLGEAELMALVLPMRDKLQALEEQRKRVMESILKDNADNIIPAAFSDYYADYYETEELKTLFADGKPYADHPMSKRLKEYIADRVAADQILGGQFIDLEEADPDGVMHKLSEYCGKGNYVLIDFWATWCGPCMAEMPNVKANYEKYKSKGFNIVGLSFDQNKEKWIQVIKEKELNWVHLSDLQYWNSLAGRTYHINAIPSSLLVDPSGKIIAKDLRGEALGQKLAEIYGF